MRVDAVRCSLAQYAFAQRGFLEFVPFQYVDNGHNELND